MTKFTDTKKEISLNDILNLEKRVDFTLPESYKNHLLKFNGGRCEPNIFSFNENGVITESDVYYFYAIHEGEYDNLEVDFNDFKIEEKRLPNSFFTIAHDSGGNLICMDAISEKVYFWDHESEVDYSIQGDEVRDNLYFISDSLGEFILSLKEE